MGGVAKGRPSSKYPLTVSLVDDAAVCRLWRQQGNQTHAPAEGHRVDARVQVLWVARGMGSYGPHDAGINSVSNDQALFVLVGPSTFMAMVASKKGAYHGLPSWG